MRHLHSILVSLGSALMSAVAAPNILWIITDDQRADSVAAYNRAMTGQDESALGYVESPFADQLAAEGVLFTHANSNSPACGPSRGSMFSGRYPFRNGHYAFEVTHQSPDFVRPMIQRTLQTKGYTTASFGKSDHYIYRWGPGQGFHLVGDFDHRVHFKSDLQKNGWGDLFVAPKYGKKADGTSGIVGQQETVVFPDGRQESYFIKKTGETVSEKDKKRRAHFDQKFDLLRAHSRSNADLIIGGRNPKPAGETVDAYIVKEMTNYLSFANKKFQTLAGESSKGPSSKQPLFVQLGFHLPHTPVLPPQSFRARFHENDYTLPAFDEAELERFPPQLQHLYRAMKIAELSEEEKQTAIRDYYAFCAYGDSLLGESVQAFKDYCERHQQEYLIVYTIGDHGWHLGEQGIMAKFGPWKQSVANAAILVSSDKEKVPPGKVVSEMVEFVDFAPTFLQAAGANLEVEKYDYLDGYSLFDVLEGKQESRDYVLGECSLVCGHRAYLHSERFRFSMRTRQGGALKPANVGKKLTWAVDVPLEEVDPALFDLESDPLEQKNVALDPKYRELSEFLRAKLARIVLGDRRVECDWAQANSYHVSEFALGADDKKLRIPEGILPR